MNNAWKEMMETNVSEYISKVDFKNPDFSINEFKTELSKILGMKPAVKLKWDTKHKVNELLKASGVTNYTEVVEKVEQVDITFVDENNVPIAFKFII
jgi:hypothetical protein